MIHRPPRRETTNDDTAAGRESQGGSPHLETPPPSACATCSLRARRACLPLLCLFTVLPAQDAGAQTLRELGDLSIEQLSQIEITSVSKRPEPLGNAAAAV